MRITVATRLRSFEPHAFTGSNRARAAGLGLGLLAALATSATAATHVRELSLSEAKLEGASFLSGTVVASKVFDLPEQGVLWAEAEEASEQRAPVVVAESTEASNGRFAHIPDATFRGNTGGVVYHVQVSKGGAYRLWARTFWPDIGGNSFFLQLDDGEKTLWGNDEAPGHIGQWFWLRGPEWQLETGAHRIAIWWREDGTQLDKIALGPTEFTPAGQGGAGSVPHLARRISVTFPAFKPPSVSKWIRARPDLRDTPRKVLFEAVDADGNATRLGPSGDMTSLTITDPEESAISLRLTLVPDRETVLRGATLEYEGEPSTFAVSDGKSTFTFDRAHGHLLQISHAGLATKALVAPSGILFRLKIRHHDTRELEWLPKSAVELLRARGDDRTMAFSYRVAAPGGQCLVVCTVRADKGGALPGWTVAVENQGKGFDVVEVEYPVIRNVALGGDGTDDAMSWPHWWGGGQLVPQPAGNAPGRGYYCSGRGMMHWLDVYDKQGRGRGLFLGSEDETWLMGALVAEAHPELGAVNLALSKVPRIRPGRNWQSKLFRCGLHKGDWHAGADLYRAWLSRHVRYDPLDWVVECDGWLGRGRGSNFLKDIPAHFRLAKSLGLNYVEFWGQMMVGLAVSDSGCNRLYFPDPRYGSEADFAKAIRYVRDAGGHIGFYTNGQAWNPRYPKLRPEHQALLPEGVFIPDWEKEYHNYGIVRADGSYLPQYGKPFPEDPYPGAFFLMCPATEGWPRYLHHYIVGKYVKQYGVDAMYIDQVGAAVAQPCYADNHLHEEVGSWTRGHMANFRRIKEDGRKHEPSFAIATEGFGDCYGRHVDMFLISPASCSTSLYAYPGLIRYTLPDRICYDGFANGNVGGQPNREVLNSVFLLGNRFDMFPKSPRVMEYFKKLLYLRQEVGPLLYRGQYMDDVSLVTSSPEVRARWWKLAPDQAEGILVTILNPESIEGATVSLPWAATDNTCCYTADLENRLAPTDCRFMRNRVLIDVPRSDVSTALVISRISLDPPALIRVMTPVGAVGAPSAVTVRCRPLAAALAGTAKVDVEVPDGWSVEDAHLPLDRAVDLDLVVTPAANAEKRAYPITVNVRMPGGRVLVFHEKLLLHDALELRAAFHGEQVIVTVKSNAVRPLSGTCALTAPEWLGVTEREKPFHVGGKGSTEIAFATSTKGKITEPGEILAVVTAGNAKAKGRAEIRPPDISLVNWQPQNYEGRCATRILNEATDGGTLRIESQTRKDRGGWSWSSAAMPPGTKWTFSGELRTEGMRSEKSGARVRIIFFHKSKPNTGTRPPLYTEFVTGTTDWCSFQLGFEVPKETGRVQIELFNWHAEGISLWRNLTLR